MKHLIATAALALLTASCAEQTSQQDTKDASPTEAISYNEATYELMLATDVTWGALNPARGENGPRATNLWGDRTKEGPSGMLVKFKEGFASPPHIHDATYRAIVLDGEIHNADKDARELWMPDGSFWTQPSGETHITAARAATNMAFVEIDNGPYVVKSVEEAFETTERPINVHDTNVVWLDGKDINWLNKTGTLEGASLAALWQSQTNKKHKGFYLRLAPGFTGNITTGEGDFKAVIVSGDASYKAATATTPVTTMLGSYFGATGVSQHQITAGAKGVILYINTTAEFAVGNE